MLTIIIIFLTGAFFLLGLIKIPIHYVGQVTSWGKRIPGEFREEGWNWLLPWNGIILINMERVTFTVTAEKALTPDRASSKVPVTITWRPVRRLLSEFINSKKEEGVKEQLTGKIQERIREWCVNTEEGPNNWFELNQAKLEGTSILVKKIASDSLTEIPEYAQEIPTWIWLLYFSKPKPKKFLKNEEQWVEDDWKKVKDALKEIEDNLGLNSINELKEAVEKRREEISSLRTGTGNIIIEDLGIVIERLNIGDVDVLGKVADAAEMQAKEEQERLAEKLELDGVIARIKELMAEPYLYTKEQAQELIQTERAKVAKTIHETKLNVSAETRSMIEGIGSLVIKALNKKRSN